MRCPVFPIPGPAGRTLAAVVSLLVCALLWTLPADAAEADRPMRIVSLSPLLTENVFLLGAGERLVGNTSYCTKPEAAKAVRKEYMPLIIRKTEAKPQPAAAPAISA